VKKSKKGKRRQRAEGKEEEKGRGEVGKGGEGGKMGRHGADADKRSAEHRTGTRRYGESFFSFLVPSAARQK